VKVETSERHYNKAKMVGVSQRYQQMVKALRKYRGRVVHPDRAELRFLRVTFSRQRV
jgi:hypothetical protein